MNTFDFTKFKEIGHSSFINGVWYNEKTKELALDLHGSVYVYSNVGLTIADEFMDPSNSPGTVYSKLLRFTSVSAAVLLGARNEVDFKMLEFPANFGTETFKEFVTPNPRSFDIEVHYKIDNADGDFKAEVNSVSAGEAVAQVKKVLHSYGLEIKIQKVVILFNE